MKNRPIATPRFLVAMALGTLVLALQILLIRHILQLFQGNELTIGLALAVWLTGTASGSLLFSTIIRHKKWREFTPQVLLPLSLSVFILIKYLPHVFNFIPGVPLSLGATATVFFITILPIAFLCGMLFPHVVELSLDHKTAGHSEAIRSVYIGESLGALIAGVLLNFFLYSFLSSFQILGLFLALFYLILAGIRKYPGKIFLPVTTFFLMVLSLLLLIFGGTLQQKINQRVFFPYKISQNTDTPYGNIKVLQREGQSVVLNQGKVIYTIPDIYQAEAHFLLPLLLHPDPQNILIIGGNLSGFLPYLKTFPTVKEVYFVEKDPFLLDFQRNILISQGDSSGHKIHFIKEDARQIIQRLPDSLDIILLNKPEPYTLSENRFFTREFYQLLHSRLKAHGLYSFSIVSSENYINPALAAYTHLLLNTLNTVFAQIFIIPGDDQIFLVSRNLDLCGRIAAFPQILRERYLNPVYFSEAYLKYRTSPDRLDQFRQDCKKGDHQEINSDFNLKGYLFHFRTWGAISDPTLTTVFNTLQRSRWMVVIGLLLMFTYIHLNMIRKKPAFQLWNLWLVGGYSMGLEIIFILQFQILFGTVYSALALIFGLFMLGLALGAWGLPFIKDRFKGISFERVILAGFILLAVFLIIPTTRLSLPEGGGLVLSFFKWIISPLFIFLNGFLTGGYFSLLTQSYYHEFPESSPGLTYGIDLGGSVLSALGVSIVFIPILEMRGLLWMMLIFMGVQLIWRK